MLPLVSGRRAGPVGTLAGLNEPLVVGSLGGSVVVDRISPPLVVVVDGEGVGEWVGGLIVAALGWRSWSSTPVLGWKTWSTTPVLGWRTWSTTPALGWQTWSTTPAFGRHTAILPRWLSSISALCGIDFIFVTKNYKVVSENTKYKYKIFMKVTVDKRQLWQICHLVSVVN